MTIGPEIHPQRARPLPFIVAWVVMLLLGGVSLWTAFLGIGMSSVVAEFSIAAVQTAALFIVFMRLKGAPSLKWVFAVSGFFWLSFLFGLSMTDYADRQGWPPLYAPDGPSFQAHRSAQEHVNAGR